MRFDCRRYTNFWTNLFPLDAVLRSSLYSHFSESLSGLATIRAYGETERFRLENQDRVDVENRYDFIIYRIFTN